MKPKTIGQYIILAPKEAKKKLVQMYKTIKASAPKATKSLKIANGKVSINLKPSANG